MEAVGRFDLAEPTAWEELFDAFPVAQEALELVEAGLSAEPTITLESGDTLTMSGRGTGVEDADDSIRLMEEGRG